MPDENQFLKEEENRPDLKAARFQTLSARENISIAESENLPEADLSLSIGNPYIWNTASGGDPWSWSIQFSLSYNLFADTFIQSKIREAESISRQTENDYRSLSEGIDRDVKIAYATLASDLEQIKTYRDAINYLKDNVAQMEKDYRLGAVKITDLLTAYGTYGDAMCTLDALLFSSQIDWIRLQVLSGKFSLPVESTP